MSMMRKVKHFPVPKCIEDKTVHLFQHHHQHVFHASNKQQKRFFFSSLLPRTKNSSHEKQQ